MKKPRFVVCVAVCAILASPAAIATAQDDLIPLIVGFLKDPDKEVRSLALEQVRSEAPGENATKTFAELLPGLPADAQVGLLSALADRGDGAAAPSVRKLLENSESQEVRAAAIKALGSLGDAADLTSLVKFLSAGSDTEKEAAQRSLVKLPGEPISAAIAAKLREAPEPQCVALINILTTRRARNTAAQLLDMAVSDNATVRRAAMAALAQLGEAQHVAGMVQGVLKAERGRERDAAEKAIMLVCHRTGAGQQRAAPLLAVMDDLPKEDRTILLSTLGRVGGPAARKVAEAALRDPDMHDEGLRALCNWSDASIAFRLLELARTEEHPGHRRTALRALIRVAPYPDERSDQLRLDLMRTAIAMCQEDEDRLLILERAKAIRTLETLRFVRPYMDQTGYAQQACLTVVELAHHSELRETHKEEFHAALNDVISTSQDATVVDRAQRYKKGQTWVRPK